MTRLFFGFCVVMGMVSSGYSDPLMWDDFDNDDLGAGGINGGFVEVDNGVANNGSTTEAGSVASMEDGQNANIYGMVSTNGFLLNGYSSVTTRWDVTQYSIKNKISYMAFTWQNSRGYESAPALQAVIDLESGELTLQIGDDVPLGSVELDLAFGSTDSSFVLTAVFDAAGYTITGGGSLKDISLQPVSLTSTWANHGKTHGDIFSENLHLGALLSAKGNGGLEANIDSVRLDAIPEPAVAGLISIFGGGMLVSRRIFARRNDET